jgi:sulfite exporter TauE/SafE/copper chaperone CopZ
MKKIFQIKGMHCNSCASLIENELKDKVESIKVNYSTEKAEIDFNENKISENEIKDAIRKLGYNIQEINEKKENNSKKNKTGWIVVSISLLLLIGIVYFLFLKNIDFSQIKIPELGENASLILLFATGILTGFHCISMCGGFVVSYTAKNAINGYKGFKQHLVYGGSKVLSYAIIGGIFGLIGGFFAFSTKLRGIVAILAGTFMIFYAFSMFGFKFFRRFQINPKFLAKASANVSSKTKGQYKAPFFTGLLNGLFIACGPLQAMYLYAAGTGNFFTGAISLTAFGLGTLPIMLIFGSLTTAISHKTTAKILKVSAIVVLILGLIMINRGLSLTGTYNFESLIGNTKTTSGTSSNVILDNQGNQVINMDVTYAGYSPNSFVLKKGIPVKWNINVKQLSSCNGEIIVNDYNLDIKLKEGLNIVKFTPNKAGTIRWSCWMGMLRGSFVVTETGTASQQQIKESTPSSGGSCNMGANGGGCGCGGSIKN